MLAEKMSKHFLCTLACSSALRTCARRMTLGRIVARLDRKRLGEGLATLETQLSRYFQLLNCDCADVLVAIAAGLSPRPPRGKGRSHGGAALRVIAHKFLIGQKSHVRTMPIAKSQYVRVCQENPSSRHILKVCVPCQNTGNQRDWAELGGMTWSIQSR